MPTHAVYSPFVFSPPQPHLQQQRHQQQQYAQMQQLQAQQAHLQQQQQQHQQAFLAHAHAQRQQQMQQQQQQLMMQQQQQPNPRYHPGSMMQYVLTPPPSYASSPALAASQSALPSGAVGSDVNGAARVPPAVNDTDEDAARLLLGAAIGVSNAQTGTEGPQQSQSQSQLPLSLPLQDPVRSPDGVKEEERVRAAAAVANTAGNSKQHE